MLDARRSAIAVGGLVLAAVALARVPASAHFVPVPCDFITSGGFVFKDDGARANFGAHGGCKNGDWWGNVNYVDHGGVEAARPYHVKSTEITGYLVDPDIPNARDVCGVARTNADETVYFRVRLVDNGEGSNACAKDEFGIRLSNGYLVSTRPLADSGPGGGNVQLHKPNPSTTSPCPDPDADPDHCLEVVVCNGLEHPGNPSVGACP
jgi:hypothetical protein